MWWPFFVMKLSSLSPCFQMVWRQMCWQAQRFLLMWHKMQWRAQQFQRSWSEMRWQALSFQTVWHEIRWQASTSNIDANYADRHSVFSQKIVKNKILQVCNFATSVLPLSLPNLLAFIWLISNTLSFHKSFCAQIRGSPTSTSRTWPASTTVA